MVPAKFAMENQKVAIVHDWLVGGGAENVVLELHHMFPDAPIYTSYANDEWRKKLGGKVITGYLQRWPFNRLRKFLPLLRQHWFSKLDMSEFDLIISSSGNGEAKFARAAKGSKHICYCHSPTHFYWRHYGSYLQNPGFGPKPLVRFALKTLIEPLKKRDFQAAQNVDQFIANSTHIQTDIKKYYGRDSVVVHPPVDVDRFMLGNASKRQGFVTIGRQVPYKRTDLIIAACNELALPLKVIGDGPEHEKLKHMAGPTISFLTNVSDAQLPDHMAAAQAFLFASLEDFGVTPVEAMAAGTPVIAYKAGGALDYVIEGKTGTFFEQQSVQSLTACLGSFRAGAFDEATIQKAAQQFSAENFRKKISEFLNSMQNSL